MSAAKSPITTVTVIVRSPVSTVASTYSFQVARNDRIAAVNTDGAASGRITCTKACRLVQPSIRAASSSSHGRPWKNDCSVNTVSGRVSARYGSAIAWYE
jgi:hypothetical protein